MNVNSISAVNFKGNIGLWVYKDDISITCNSQEKEDKIRDISSKGVGYSIGKLKEYSNFEIPTKDITNIDVYGDYINSISYFSPVINDDVTIRFTKTLPKASTFLNAYNAAKTNDYINVKLNYMS